jgi:predicted Zn-dependent protease
MNTSRILSLSLIAAATLAATEPRAERASYNEFTDREEIIIGQSLAKKFEAKNPVVRNSLAELYLEDIVEQLAAKSQRPDVKYEVRLLNSNKVNAFSLPGAHIYVTYGLLDFVESESELVGVLSHEVGHIVGRHTMNRIARYTAVANVVQEARRRGVRLTDEMADRVATAGINIVYTLFERSFNRDEEREADLFGFYQMARADWHPKGMISMFEHLQRGSARYGATDKLLSTHPEPGERAARLRDEMGDVLLPRNLKEDSFQFQIMKRGLQLLR